MQEPEIFEQPVASKDTEAHGVADENGTYHTVVSNGLGPTPGDDNSLEDYHDFYYPEDRKLGTWSTVFLIINRVCRHDAVVLGAGRADDLLTIRLLGVWHCPAAFRGGKGLFRASISEATISSHVRICSTDGSWLNRGIAIAAITVVCLIHAFAPRWGIWLSNGFGAFKLILLSLVVCTGFAALSGRMATPRPDPSNFSSFHGPAMDTPAGEENSPGTAANYALALLQVLYSYSGWENANYVLTEVRNPPRTLRKAAPIAISAVTVLYVLANISYFAAMTKNEIADSRVVVAAQFFQNVWGNSDFVDRVVPLFIALSALGNVFAQSFAMPRVKQELAKEGVLPWSRFWASDWPFNAPTGAIFLHWLFTCAFILGSHTSDVYLFVTNVFIYSGNWIKLLLGIGLVYLNFSPAERWAEQRTTFRSSPLLTIFWIVSLLFVQAAMFIENNLLLSVPFYVVPTLGTSLLALGTVYWLIWAKVLPAFGYHIQHEIVQMPDGSERVKYKRVKPKRRRKQEQWKRRKRPVW
ncbi:hypothetical protein MFIFM68171_10314 [Madurella fahalii]|uniref:Uncharacterized protein n=1 Tax=Madurella fahalii TaxID=1157608 RepID=A0ABQ0GQV7_9PEZI